MTLQHITEIPVHTGDTLYIAPLGFYFWAAIERKARELFPDVDPTPYQRAIPDDEALVPGMKTDARDNPDYLKAVADVDQQRDLYVQESIIRNVVVDAASGKDALVEAYQDRLQLAREFGALPDDDWQAVVLAFLVVTSGDRNMVINAARGALPITEEEVKDSFRLFRLNLPSKTAVGSDRRQTAQGISAQKPVPDEQAV